MEKKKEVEREGEGEGGSIKFCAVKFFLLSDGNSDTMRKV
jgi:hypothetical protein